MFNKNKIEELNNRNDYVPIEKFIKNSKELFEKLNPIYKDKKPSNKPNVIFKYLSHIQFGIYILPFLSLKEILSLRATNKEINFLICSNICCLNYYFKTLKKFTSLNEQSNISNNKHKISSQLKPFHELNDESEFLEQKNILNKIKNYIKSPEFSLEHLMHIYRVEMDYLKYEEKHQEKYMNSLIETRKKINEEYQLIIGNNKNRKKSSIHNMEKNIINEDSLKELSDEELKKKIEELKMKKEKLIFEYNNAKKTNEELKTKNDENAKIINKIKNIFNSKKGDEDNENDNDNDNIDIVKEFLKKHN
jgi:hypothetical protein